MTYCWEMFARSAARDGSARFLSSPSGDLDYADAVRVVRDLAAQLVDSASGKGRLVGLPTDLGGLEAIGFLAINLAGATAVPFLPTAAGEAARLADLGVGGSLRLDGRRIEWSPTSAERVPRDARTVEEHAYVLSTSGSSGVPKHVGIDPAGVAAFGEYLSTAFDLSSSDVVCQNVSPHFDAYYMVLLLAILNGASMHVPARGRTLLVGDVVREQGVTVWYSVPSVIRLAKRAGKLPAGSLATVHTSIFGGEPLRVSDVQDWRQAAPNSVIVNSYGPTEMTIAMTEHRVEPNTEPAARDGIVAIGRPVNGVEIRLGETTDSGFRELLARGPQRFDGYLEAGESVTSLSPFVDDDGRPVPADPGDKSWYRTGDLVSAEDGLLFYRGRLDGRAAKVLGQRFDPVQVEAVLLQDHRVEAAFVHVVSDRIVAVLETVDGGPLENPPDVGSLRPYARPFRYVAVAGFPLLASGKTDVRKLRSIAEGNASNG